jgi:hypothetical protein
MTLFFWLAGLGTAVGLAIFSASRYRDENLLGTLSTQWLAEHRRESHQRDR